ncbi:MAG: hypothetical protein AAF701_00255, partial [Pseudomonadota bacterium]
FCPMIEDIMRIGIMMIGLCVCTSCAELPNFGTADDPALAGKRVPNFLPVTALNQPVGNAPTVSDDIATRVAALRARAVDLRNR